MTKYQSLLFARVCSKIHQGQAGGRLTASEFTELTAKLKMNIEALDLRHREDEEVTQEDLAGLDSKLS